MEYRPLGATGRSVSVLGFGAGAIGGLMTRGSAIDQTRAVARALDAGITYFDTAPLYGDGQSEINLGRALSQTNGWGRVTVGTKVRLTNDDLTDPPLAIRRSFEASLRRLGRDRIDLLQLHNSIIMEQVYSSDGLPVSHVLEGVADGLSRLVTEGLVGNIGLTAMGDTSAIQTAIGSGRFATIQSYFNALNPSAGYPGAVAEGQDYAGLIDQASAANVGVIVIRPFAGGALAGQATRHPLAGDPGQTAMAGSRYGDDLARASAVARLAADCGFDGPLELGLRFAMTKPGVSTVIVGYSDSEHLEAALTWAERGPLTRDIVERIVALRQMT